METANTAVAFVMDTDRVLIVLLGFGLWIPQLGSTKFSALLWKLFCHSLGTLYHEAVHVFLKYQ